MAWHDHIERNPAVMLGKPVIKGTRITVELILHHMGAGASIDDLLSSYPHIKREQIHAALEYAADALSTDERIILQETSHWTSSLMRIWKDKSSIGYVNTATMLSGQPDPRREAPMKHSFTQQLCTAESLSRATETSENSSFDTDT